MLMEMAGVISSRGTCQRAHVGVVIAREGRVLVTGYNGAPAGMPHCTHDTVSIKDVAQGCQIAVHAECNAIAYAARWGISTEGADMYTTHAPCLPCAMLIVNSGIRRVVYQKEYRIKAGADLLRAAKIELVAAE